MKASAVAALLLLVGGCNPARQPRAVAQPDSGGSPQGGSSPNASPPVAGASDGSIVDAGPPPAPTRDAESYLETARASCPTLLHPKDISTRSMVVVPDPKPDPVPHFGWHPPRPILLEGDETPHWPPELATRGQGIIILKCTIAENGLVNNCRFIKTDTDEHIARLMRETALTNVACRRYGRYRVDGKIISIDYTFISASLEPRHRDRTKREHDRVV